MFTLPELPYAYDALEPYIDEETMKIHHDKHHGTYVKNLNDACAGEPDLLNLPVTELIRDLARIPENIRMKVRNNGGGHANHSLFWTLMGTPGKDGGGKPVGKLLGAVNTTFGSLEGFQEQFTKAALGRFGSGWIWLVKSQGKLAIVDTPNQDSPLADGQQPILALDVWEHAYYLKYRNMRTDYIKAWWNVVNWSQAAKLLS